MLSSAGNPTYRGDSTMPGGYEPFLGAVGRNGPPADSFSAPGSTVPTSRTPFPQISTTALTGVPPARTSFPQVSPIVPTNVSLARTPFPQASTAPPIAGLPATTPFPHIPMGPPVTGLSRRRPHMMPMRRPVRIHRRRRRPLTPEIVIERRSHHRSSCGRHHVITIPLDNRPTLGLRGPPRRVLEIERVRCHRPRRHHSYCYEYDYDDPPPQPTTIVANAIPDPCLPLVQPSLLVPTNHTTAATTSAVLSNLTPQSIDNLPKQTVHLEPIHLPGSHADATTGLHTVVFPAEIINPVDGTLSIIQANPAANSGAIVNIPHTISTPVRPQSFNLPTVLGTSLASVRPPLLASPAAATNPLAQRFRELFQRMSIAPTQPIVSAPNAPMTRPVFPNISQSDPRNNTVSNPPMSSSVNSPNERQAFPTNIPSANRSSTGFSGSPNLISNQPSTISPYRTTTTFTPSRLPNNPTTRPQYSAPSISSDIGPYRPANITPYSNVSNRSTNNPVSQSSFSSGPTPYASAASLASTNTFNTFSSPSSPLPAPDHSYLNSSFSSSSAPPPSSFSSPPSNNSMPRSILRNTPSTNLSNTTDTRLSSSNMFASNNSVPKMTRFT